MTTYLVQVRERPDSVAGANVLRIVATGVVQTAGQGGGGGATTLDDLTDVAVAAPADNQALVYESGTLLWQNRALTEADVTNLVSDLAGKQPLDATLTALAGVVTAADTIEYFTGVDTAASTALTAAGRALIDDASASAQRTTLGLGTMATEAASSYLPLVAAGASVENIGAVESNVNTVAATGATETLDTSLYGVHDCTMDAGCTFTFSNPAPSGKATVFVLILRGAFTPVFPNTVDWSGGAAPTYTTPSVYTFCTVDGGTVWIGQQVGAGFA
jgi:hypothetical protein